jgi:adenylosuccinate synthase
MKAIAIIGANYGDEGKGLMTDYICSKGNTDVVVRFNGGAQAGHTVATPTGQRHVFQHFGSGTFAGVPTYLSKFFLVNPVMFHEERAKLMALKATPIVSVDMEAQVTTPADMLINQAFEKKGGHGSCGVGINETMQRVKAGYGLTVNDLLDQRKIERIYTEWVPARIKALALDMPWGEDQIDLWTAVFKTACNGFLDTASVVRSCFASHVLFEGAQGLALDQRAKGFPHVTHSNTGMKNVRELCMDFGLPAAKPIYVTRSYLTRHGKGPLPHEMQMPAWVKDSTNVSHEFQGTLRYAPLNFVNIEAMHQRIFADVGDQDYEFAVTCIDQSPQGLSRMKAAGLPVRYESRGPTRTTITQVKDPITA